MLACVGQVLAARGSGRLRHRVMWTILYYLTFIIILRGGGQELAIFCRWQAWGSGTLSEGCTAIFAVELPPDSRCSEARFQILLLMLWSKSSSYSSHINTLSSNILFGGSVHVTSFGLSEFWAKWEMGPGIRFGSEDQMGLLLGQVLNEPGFPSQTQITVTIAGVFVGIYLCET